jgi:hypothetical protein
MGRQSVRQRQWRTHAAIAASVVLHATLLYGLATITILGPARRRAERLTDAPASVLMSLDGPANVPANHATAREPPPPEPAETGSDPETIASPEIPAAGAAHIETADAPVPAAAPAPPPPPPPPPPLLPLPPPPPSPPAGQQIAPPTASFAGVEGTRAGRIVYVIDASAAMIPTFPYLKGELVASLARLDPTQSFQIIAYRQRPPVDGRDGPPDVRRFDTRRPFVGASRAARADAERWLESLEPSGSSVPLTGLREALSLSPDLIFLLTTSIPRSGTTWGEGTQATLEALDRLNPINPLTGQRPTVIKTIAFLHEDATGMLPAIAEAHGDGTGSYRVVSEPQMVRVPVR